MFPEKILRARAADACELCNATDELSSLPVPPDAGKDPERHILACAICREQLTHPEQADANHWHCLNEAMWKPVPAIQVASWRMLKQLFDQGESWAQDLLDLLYLDEETQAWAEAGLASEDEQEIQHRDCHGNRLQAGDSVILTKDLNVKGAGFTAKRGTTVRNISLVSDNADQIEGRVNGQQIVILTQFVKKAG